MTRNRDLYALTGEIYLQQGRLFSGHDPAEWGQALNVEFRETGDDSLVPCILVFWGTETLWPNFVSSQMLAHSCTTNVYLCPLQLMVGVLGMGRGCLSPQLTFSQPFHPFRHSWDGGNGSVPWKYVWTWRPGHSYPPPSPVVLYNEMSCPTQPYHLSLTFSFLPLLFSITYPRNIGGGVVVVVPGSVLGSGTIKVNQI